MGIVIAYKDTDCVLFASDTQRSMGGFRLRGMKNGASMNIIHLDEGVTVGFSGEVRVKEVLTFQHGWFSPIKDKPLTKRFLMKEIIPRLYDGLVDRNFLAENSVKSGHSKMNGTFLLAKGTDLFYIDSDFSVVTIGEYAVIGENSYFALARCDTLQESSDKKETMLAALKDVQRQSNNVSAPFYFTDTKRKKFIFAEEQK